MFVKLPSAAPMGLECLPVEVEVDIQKGQTAFNIVGLADAAIQEARDRIHSAIKNSGFNYPFNFRVLINLAPADLHKEGPAYDLPMAVGMAAITSGLSVKLGDALIAGELALDGGVRHVNGILPLALFAKKHGLKRIFVPEMDAAEAALAGGPIVYPVKTLGQIMAHLADKEQIAPHEPEPETTDAALPIYDTDFAFVRGQEFAKRALEIAAAGGHNVILSGPPGSGKTLLSRAFVSILPRLTPDEALEVTKIYSVAGLLRGGIIRERPFRSPHHTASGIALVGGGRVPRPGEISLAHRGVLFLDEFPEFSRFVIEALRQPLEDGEITVSRAHGTFTFPARFILVASQNPCPCGYLGDAERPCVCSPSQLFNYRKKISGPIMDRIDLQVEVPKVEFEKLSAPLTGENSDAVRERVEVAREIQRDRLSPVGLHTNSEMRPQDIAAFCRLAPESLELLRAAMRQMNLSARSYNRILKVTRTVADLAGADDIGTEHLAEALQCRGRE